MYISRVYIDALGDPEDLITHITCKEVTLRQEDPDANTRLSFRTYSAVSGVGTGKVWAAGDEALFKRSGNWGPNETFGKAETLTSGDWFIQTEYP